MPLETRWVQALGRLEGGFCIAILIAMPLLLLLEMTLRKAGLQGISGTMPMVQHMTLLVAFAGAALAARSGQLLKLSTAEVLPARWKPASAFISSSVGAGLSTWLAVSSFGLIQVFRESGNSVASDIPIWVVLLIMPLAFAIIAVRLLMSAAATRIGRLAALVGCAIPVAATLSPELRDSGMALPAGLIVVVAVLLGMPIFAAIGGAALLLFWNADIPVGAVADEMYKLSASEFLPAIPLFALSGYILAAGGASDRLKRAFTSLFGWIPGGLAIVTTLVLAFFTPLTGASGVTILSMGRVFRDMMTHAGYRENASIGLITVAGSIGLLLPPSLPVILYAISAQIPIPTLFAAAAVPAALLILAVAGWGAFDGSRSGAVSIPFQFREAFAAMWGAKWDLLLPVVVLTAYFGGYATLVETSAVTVLYTVILECVIYRGAGVWRRLPAIAVECSGVIGGFLIVIAAALAFTNYLVTAEVPTIILAFVQTHIHSPWVFLLALNLFLIIVGALMDIYSAILVVVPLIVPIGAAYGIDPVLLGVVFLANMELGYLMPPMGENLFLSSLAFNKPLSVVYRATVPFVIALLITVLLITYVPALTGITR